MEVPGFGVFAELYSSDPYFGKIWSDLKNGVSSDFVLLGDFIFKGTRLCVLTFSLRLQIIKELHIEGHVGRDRSVQLVPGHIIGLHYSMTLLDTLSISLLVYKLRVMPQTSVFTCHYRFQHSFGWI